MIVGLNAFIWSNFFRPGEPKTKPSIGPTPTLIHQSGEVEQVLAAKTADETNLIKLAVFTKTGLDDSTSQWTILNKANGYASGSLTPRTGGEKLFWFAVKKDQDWECIYASTSKPKCDILSSYNFPQEISGCLK